MQISILLMEQIFELFLMILMGFIIVKAGIVKEEDSKVLSKIVLYLIIPCVIINAFQVDYTKKTVNGLLIALAASVLLQVVLLLVVFMMGKLFSLNEVETASIYYSNSGNLIVPIVTFVLGQKWVLYGCVFMSVQLVFLWTHCKKIISRESSYDWKKIILNINMISIAIGAILVVTFYRIMYWCHFIFHQNPAAGTHYKYHLQRWKYDRTGQHDCNWNAFCRNGFKGNFCK